MTKKHDHDLYLKKTENNPKLKQLNQEYVGFKELPWQSSNLDSAFPCRGCGFNSWLGLN